MKPAPMAWLGVTAVFVAGGDAVAQQPTRTLDAALEALERGRGRYDASLFAFRGCPQDDPIGREIFEAVTNADVGGRDLTALAQIAILGTYPDCAYEPLNDWLVEVVGRLHVERDNGALNSLGFYLVHSGSGTMYETSPLIHRELQEALLRVAEDDRIMGGVREELADVALRQRPEEAQIVEVIQALERPIPRMSKTLWVYHLGRRHGGRFFVPLAEAAATFSDDDLETVVNAIGTDVRDGRVDAAEDGLAALRALVENRPSLPTWVHIPGR